MNDDQARMDTMGSSNDSRTAPASEVTLRAAAETFLASSAADSLWDDLGAEIEQAKSASRATRAARLVEARARIRRSHALIRDLLALLPSRPQEAEKDELIISPAALRLICDAVKNVVRQDFRRVIEEELDRQNTSTTHGWSIRQALYRIGARLVACDQLEIINEQAQAAFNLTMRQLAASRPSSHEAEK